MTQPYQQRLWILLGSLGTRPWLLFALFMVGVLLLTPKDLGSLFVQGAYYAYAAFVFWTIWHTAQSTSSHQEKRNARFFIWLLALSVGILLFSRLLPFIQHGETPLGYDTGFYIKGIENAIHDLNSSRIARGLVWIPLVWMGISSGLVLHGLYVVTQLLIAGSLYMLARSMAQKAGVAYAAIVLFLYAVSLPQFFAYWWMYYQTMVALAFLLMTLALFYRRSWLAFLTMGFGIAVHPPTFFALGIAVALFLVIRPLWHWITTRRVESEVKYLALFAAVAIAAGFVVLRLTDPGLIYSYAYGINAFGWFVTNYPEHIREQMRGLFINAHVFQLSTVYVIPFVVSGILLLWLRQAADFSKRHRAYLVLLLLFLLVLLVLVSIPIVYQNRFIIYLDLVYILFGAYGLLLFVRGFLGTRLGVVVLAMLFGGLLYFNLNVVWHQQPQITSSELDEIRALSYKQETGSFAMATHALYTPWVYAYSEHPAIGPGYLQDKWDYGMWDAFWSDATHERRAQMLNIYGKPVYIFVGKWIFDESLPYVKFLQTNPDTTRVSEHVWKYDPYDAR